MANVKLLQLKEQVLKFNNEVSVSKGLSVEIGVGPTLLVNDKDDTFAIQLQVVYKRSDDVVFIDYAMLAVFSAENWHNDMLSYGSELDKIKENATLKRAMDLSLGCVRGALAIRTMNTNLEGAYLPDLPVDGILENLSIKKV
jgi:hypothetical protein